ERGDHEVGLPGRRRGRARLPGDVVGLVAVGHDPVVGPVRRGAPSVGERPAGRVGGEREGREPVPVRAVVAGDGDVRARREVRQGDREVEAAARRRAFHERDGRRRSRRRRWGRRRGGSRRGWWWGGRRGGGGRGGGAGAGGGGGTVWSVSMRMRISAPSPSSSSGAAYRRPPS